MKGFLAVARREIEEKRFVFLAAAVASLVPFAVPVVRGMHGANAAEARDWTAVMLAVTFAAGLAAALGGTVVASDLVEHRLGFYFSRPLSGLAIWAGKLGAACLIALGAAAIVYFPTLAENRGRIILLDLPEKTPGLFFLGVIAVVLLWHAAAVAMRPRSALLAADLAAFIVLALGALFIVQQLAMAMAGEALRRGQNMLIVAAAVALAVSGFVAVTRGRTDSRAAHRALSASLWGILAVGVAAVGVYTAWVFSATPHDLQSVASVIPAGRGTWIMVQGEARGAQPAFLFDTATGRYQRAGADWRWPVLSPDGTRAFWLQSSGPRSPFEGMIWNLSDPDSKPARTILSFPDTPTPFLSEDGERLAAISGGLLSIYDLASGTNLGSARLGDRRFYPRGYFLDRNRFRLFRDNLVVTPSARSVDILEFDVATKTLTVTGSIDLLKSIFFTASPAGNRLLCHEGAGFSLRDARSGALLATLVDSIPTPRSPGRFLSDGRIVVPVVRGSEAHLELFNRDGRLERTVPIPARDRIALGGEAAPGKLVVAAEGIASERESRAIFLVDLSSGEVRKVGDRLFPVVYSAGWISNRPNYQPEPGSEATRLFFGPGRSLVHLDPLTGERRVILGDGKNR
jgi:hypothetical protein